MMGAMMRLLQGVVIDQATFTVILPRRRRRRMTMMTSLAVTRLMMIAVAPTRHPLTRMGSQHRQPINRDIARACSKDPPEAEEAGMMLRGGG